MNCLRIFGVGAAIALAALGLRGVLTRATRSVPGAPGPAESRPAGTIGDPLPGALASGRARGRGPARETISDGAPQRMELDAGLARLATALAAMDGEAMGTELEALLADPELVARLLDELVLGTWHGDEARLDAARLALEAALALAHEEGRDPEVARRLVRSLLWTLPSLPPPERAEFLESLAWSRSGEAAVVGMRYLREVLDLRMAYPELRDELAPLLVNLAERAEEGGSFEEFHALLVAESGDPLAVRVALSGLLKMGGDSFLPLAEELLRGAADEEMRAAVLQSIAATAGPDVAAEAMARLADPTDVVPLLTLGGRPGSARALGDAYARLVATGDSNPGARRALVTGMHEADEALLHSIATRDADPEVRAQALLTWSASRDPSPLAFQTVRQAIDDARAAGDEHQAARASMAAGNLLARSSGEERVALRELMVSMALDTGHGLAARRAALRVLTQQAPGAIPPGLAEELE